MEKFNAEKVLAMGAELFLWTAILYAEKPGSKEWNDKLTSQVGLLDGMANLLDSIGCTLAAKSARLLAGQLPFLASQHKEALLQAHLGVMTSVKHEMESHLFFWVPSDREKYYTQKEPLFGEAVFDAFPSLIDDVSEAGKCLALDRGTACVFHLMRVMEGGLRALSNQFDILYAPSWESHITQITAKISAKHETKGDDWKRDEPFFKDVLGDLTAVKMAWRNPTMHIVKAYSVEQAGNVLTAVRAFMQHLATRLKEVPRV